MAFDNNKNFERDKEFLFFEICSKKSGTTYKVRMFLRQAFEDIRKKNSRRKNSKLKPKALKVGTFFTSLTFLSEKLQVL